MRLIGLLGKSEGTLEQARTRWAQTEAVGVVAGHELVAVYSAWGRTKACRGRGSLHGRASGLCWRELVAVYKRRLVHVSVAAW